MIIPTEKHISLKNTMITWDDLKYLKSSVSLLQKKKKRFRRQEEHYNNKINALSNTYVQAVQYTVYCNIVKHGKNDKVVFSTG